MLDSLEMDVKNALKSSAFDSVCDCDISFLEHCWGRQRWVSKVGPLAAPVDIT